MDYEVKEVEMEDEFKVCPSCGYEDAFHSMFRKKAASPNGFLSALPVTIFSI